VQIQIQTLYITKTALRQPNVLNFYWLIRNRIQI